MIMYAERRDEFRRGRQECLRHIGGVLVTAVLALAQTPREAWRVAPGADDLISAGFWTCVPGVQVDGGRLTIGTGNRFNTVLNTAGPHLKVRGDFSLLATISAGGFVSLVGTIGHGEWWNGAKRLDVGVADGGLRMVAWTGASAEGAGRTYPLSPMPDPLHLEIARIGPDIVAFVSGREIGRMSDPGLFESGRIFLGFHTTPGSTLSVRSLAAAAPAGSSSNVALDAPFVQTIERSGNGLRDAAEGRGFLVGAAVNPARLGIEEYAQTLGREFNLVVAENAMKFAATEPARGRYDFCAADQVVTFARANHMQVRGHTLVWHQNLPRWLTEGNFSREDAVKILHDHIRAVAGHFKGKLLCWDVVNESIAYGPPYGPQRSFWLDKIGPEYVDMAFRWARETDPDVKLFYNETGGEGLGTKSDVVYNLVKGMRERGVPLDGVGLQMHTSLDSAHTESILAGNIGRLGKLGLEVHITEMDVRLRRPAGTETLIQQANVYRAVARACLANANCKALVTWGVGDAYSWIPRKYKGFGAGLLFDEQFRPKRAYGAVSGVLSAAP